MIRIPISCIILTISIYRCGLVSSVDIPGIKQMQELIKDKIGFPSNSMQTVAPATSTETSENGGTTAENFTDISGEDKLIDNDLEAPPCELTPSENRAARAGEAYRWPKATVPYVIDPNFPQDQYRNIIKSMALISNVTCVKFRKRTSSKNYVYFLYGGNGCSSPVGMLNLAEGRQNINLKPAVPGKSASCGAYIEVIVHEIMHALGCGHEMVRDDRDQYVEIVRDNIKKEHLHNFEFPNYKQNNFNIGFDYTSIMMYRWNDFALDNQKPTIIAKQPGIGHNFKGDKMSPSDIKLINSMYKCPRN